MADITVHSTPAIWSQLGAAGTLYNVISDEQGNLHAYPVAS